MTMTLTFSAPNEAILKDVKSAVESIVKLNPKVKCEVKKGEIYEALEEVRSGKTEKFSDFNKCIKELMR